MQISTSDEVLAFWREAGPDKWFTKDEAFDAEVQTRFLATYEAARDGHLTAWEETPEGAFALLILLDQFPRNMFRGRPEAFATDPLARDIAARALDKGYDEGFPVDERAFFYMPFMHSETLADQERCVTLFQERGPQANLKYAIEHRDIIRDFGRFPHRNPILGREATEAEAAFLANGGFAG